MNDNSINEKQEKKGETAYKVVLAVTGITAGLLVLVYLAGAFFFGGHYYWKTQIDGTDYSFQSRERVREEILNPAVDYQLRVTGREGMEEILYPDQLGMTYVFDDTLDRLNAEQSGLKWPQMLWTSSNWTLPKAVMYDEDVLEKRLRESTFFAEDKLREPRDAYIGDYVSGEGYSIVAEDPGTILDYDRVKAAVKEALENLEETLDLQEGDYYSGAAVKSDDTGLKKALETANRYVSTRIIYTWNGETEVVDGDVISGWVSIEDDVVSLDEEAVREYVNAMAKKHDTYGRDRNFTTTNGDTVLLKSGSYGWWTDRAGETEALVASIKQGEQLEKEPLYFCRGYAEGPAGEDIGSSYVEVDLGHQHLYLYIEGELILESDLVSGNIAKGHGTPAGVFGLTYKERNATLTGENYASHVDYWMPFNGNIGMHDASWRKKFGGDIYLTNGSHGCVNLPEDVAARIYGYVEQNFPVICYY